MELLLCSGQHGNINISLHLKTDDDYYDTSIEKEMVYNDDSYTFFISETSVFPNKFYINDEAYNIETLGSDENGINFKLADCQYDMPFLHCFGAVKIEVETNDQIFISKSISVLVSSNYINSGVMNMVDYIYENCENYLYEEHRFSSVSTGVKDNKIISLEAKIKILKEVLDTYKQAYQYLKVNPYSKLKKQLKVDSFEKLQSISSDTINYIAQHADELIPVNYNTGIKYNKQFYQPGKTLIEQNVYSFDTYENHVIIGFLHTIIIEISDYIQSVQKRLYIPNKPIPAGYENSMYKIFSANHKKLKESIDELNILKNEFQQLNYHYTKLFGISGAIVKSIPKFTPVFKAIGVYRQIYQAIYDWFTCGNYDLRKDDLLLSFISTSKIYEFYCLLKMLCYLDKQDELKFSNAQRYEYAVKSTKGGFDNNTKYNNTFIFEKKNEKDRKITIYFQPFIYSNDFGINDIKLYRNTTFDLKDGKNRPGKLNSHDFVYTPDYIIKFENNNFTNYLIMDAKFSNPKTIRKNQMQELVFKYLFSLGTLKENDNILGLYIMCGKTSENDDTDIIHDVADKINRSVQPFAEIVIMNGTDTNNYKIPAIIYDKIRSLM